MNVDCGVPQDTAQSTKYSLSPSNKPTPEVQEPLPAVTAEEAEETKTTEITIPRPDAVRLEPSTNESYDFYLLRPRTSSNRRVLVPLTSSDTLGDALRGCTVEEFPTIYYFSAASPDLPKDFMIDEDYRKEEGEQQREFEELMKDVDPDVLKRLRDDGSRSKADEEVDSKKILDVLKQDLGGL